MIESHSSNLVITTNVLGVRIFKKFTVMRLKDVEAIVYCEDPDQTAPEETV